MATLSGLKITNFVESEMPVPIAIKKYMNKRTNQLESSNIQLSKDLIIANATINKLNETVDDLQSQLDDLAEIVYDLQHRST